MKQAEILLLASRFDFADTLKVFDLIEYDLVKADVHVFMYSYMVAKDWHG